MWKNGEISGGMNVGFGCYLWKMKDEKKED
jgi:hypothetical protein